MKHTPEPWKVNQSRHENEPYKIVLWSSFRRIAKVYHEGKSIYENEKTSEANAKRIVDCVNALAGIENPKEFVERMAKLEAALKPLADLADAAWADQRERGSDVLYQFNAATITIDHLKAAKSLLS